MTLGVSTANVANRWLSVFNNTAFTAITTVYVRLHVGDPGAAGTSNASANTTRQPVTWSPAASGSMSMNGSLSWAAWASGSETISHISMWDASTGGNFLWSGALSASKSVANGDTLNITALTVAVTPLAA